MKDSSTQTEIEMNDVEIQTENEVATKKNADTVENNNGVIIIQHKPTVFFNMDNDVKKIFNKMIGKQASEIKITEVETETTTTSTTTKAEATTTTTTALSLLNSIASTSTGGYTEPVKRNFAKKSCHKRQFACKSTAQRASNTRNYRRILLSSSSSPSASEDDCSRFADKKIKIEPDDDEDTVTVVVSSDSGNDD